MLFFSLLCTIPSLGRTIDVGKGKTFPTIHDALKSAQPHDEIVVYAGKVYKEHLLIDKPITLKVLVCPLLTEVCKATLFK